MFSSILHATDLSENHFELCEKALEIAKCFHAKLYLMHVIQPPASLQIAQGLGFAEFDAPVLDNAKTVMNVVGDALSLPKEHLLVEVGPVKHTILKRAKELHCSLLVIGSHTPTHLPSFLGSTAYALVHHAPCNVLILRPTENVQKNT